MAYCRWGDGDLYIYRTGDETFICQCCPFEPLHTNGFPLPSDRSFDSREGLLEHVKQHEKAGHEAPYEHVYARLEWEIANGVDLLSRR